MNKTQKLNIPSIAQEVAHARLIGVGESTHGTHEFFSFKAALFQELVSSHDFNVFLLEDQPQSCSEINEYIKTGQGDLDELVQKLYSVWRVEELRDLIIWLHENRSRYQVDFVGFDTDQPFNGTNERDERMAGTIRDCMKNNPSAKALIWAHNFHIQKASADPKYRLMGMFLKEWFGGQYLSIGQFFGRGTLNATHRDELNLKSLDRTMKPLAVTDIPADFLEAQLDKISQGAVFLNQEAMSKYPSLNKTYTGRGIGWGLIPAKVNHWPNISPHNVMNDFDYLVYFSEGQASRWMGK